MKSCYCKIIMICKNNYSCNYFCKMLYHRYLTAFWIWLRFSTCQGSQHTWVLNIPGFAICPWFSICQSSECTRIPNMPEFWIYQCSEYAPGSQYCRVLNMPDSQYAWIIPEYMSDYAWIGPNIPGYVGICVNMPKSAWMAFTFSLLHLMRAIARAHTSIRATSLMRVKHSMRHFCLWHLLCGTLKWKKNETKIKSITLNSWSFFFNLCYTFVRSNVVLPCPVWLQNKGKILSLEWIL